MRAPWTAEQIKSLNDYQEGGVFHEYTCGAEHDDNRVLLATEDGWQCVEDGCRYRQDWAHAWTADDSWRQLGLDVLMPKGQDGS